MEKNGLMEILKMICWTILSMIGFVGRCLWVKDEKTAISGGDGVELWPRMAATAKFSLQDMKTVKRAIPNAVSILRTYNLQLEGIHIRIVHDIVVEQIFLKGVC